jgi:histidine phosphotransferase ChpT
LELAAAACARICHDLAGSAGALVGMLEMTRPDGSPDPEAWAVAQDSANELAHRLRLFRAAWGEAGEIPDLAGLARGLPRAERIRVDVSAVSDDTARRQLAASLMLVAANGLPRGGTVWIGEPPAEAGLAVRIEGPRAAWPASMAAQLAGLAGGAACAADPQTAGLVIAWLQARLLGMTIAIVSPTTLAIRAFTESSAASGQSGD